MARGTGTKLAEVLKRTGLASSINDANRIASLDRLKMDFKKWGYTNYNTQFLF